MEEVAVEKLVVDVYSDGSALVVLWQFINV